MFHNNGFYIDLSINGIKIDISDSNVNDNSYNRNNSHLHNSSDKNSRLLTNSPWNDYCSNEKLTQIDINRKNNEFHMKVNRILQELSDKKKLSEKEQPNHYTKFLENIDKRTQELEREKQKQDNNMHIVSYRHTKNDLNTLLKTIENRYNNNNYHKVGFSGFLEEKQPTKLPNYHAVPPPPSLRTPINYEPKIEKKMCEIKESIDNLDDLIKMIDKYPLADNVDYNINMKNLHAIREPLTKLQNMIGMNQLKTNIVDQILYFIQDLHSISDKDNQDFMHTVIYGPPGTGKTEIAKIMGSIFSNLGILKKNIFKKATRSDLVAGYLGQTAIKTKDLVNACLGGVLFIDEAYALGNEEKRDSFAKECIDTLCEALSDHKDEIMVIIAGYESELKKCFFNYNQGLESRFTWRFHTDDYQPEELKKIFEKKITDAKWSIANDDEFKVSWFEQNKEYFKYYGRDMETLFAKTKIAHSRRVFCLPKKEKTKITMKDLEKGFELYLQNDEVKERAVNGEFERTVKQMLYV